MTPEPITINGRSGTVVYLDADWHPVSSAGALMAKVVFEDGGIAFYMAQETVRKYDPNELRDEKGRWAKGGKTGNVFLHGTAQAFLEDIIKNGIKADHAGLIHKTTILKKPLAKPGHIYLTTDEEEARRYALSASLEDRTEATVLNPVYMEGIPRDEKHSPMYDAGVMLGGQMPAVVKVKLPLSVVQKLRADKRSDILSKEHRVVSKVARSYKGDIKPEWMESISYQTLDLATGEETWVTIDPKEWKRPGPTTPSWLKAAAEGTVFYIPMRLPVEKAEGIGGITRKFDAAQHPRGEDGRFIEASQPRIFNRLEDVAKTTWGWPGDAPTWGWKDPKTGEVTGRLLTGEPIPPEEMRASLFHVTTDAPAVEASGVLLGQLGDGGLGGGQAPGVSFTTSHEDAVVIQRELRRSIRVARGEDSGIAAIERYAREDEKEAGLAPGTLNDAVEFAQYNWHDPEPDDPPDVLRSYTSDALRAYLQIRGNHDISLLKNPILFGRQEVLAKLNPENVQILDVPSYLIPEGALVTTGSDKFLHEVRAYSDVPLLKRVQSVAKFDEAEHPREPGGTAEGGQFAETGRVGEVTSEPRLVKQAQDGIAAIEKLLPQAIEKTPIATIRWEDLKDDAKTAVYRQWLKETETTYDLYQGQQADEWDKLSGDDKFDLAVFYARNGKVPGAVQLQHKEPDHWTTGVTEGDASNEDDYRTTRNLALRLIELRTDELRKERGLLKGKPTYTITSEGESNFVIHDAEGHVIAKAWSEKSAKLEAEKWAALVSTQNISTNKIIEDVWTAWKYKSSEGLGLSLQLAAAQEFDGVHRMSPEEVREAEDNAMQYGGIDTLRAYVRAQWETTQFVMARAGEKKVDVYRALMMPVEKVEATANVPVIPGYEDHPLVPEHIAPIRMGTDLPGKPTHVEFFFNGERMTVKKEIKMVKTSGSSDDPNEGFSAELESDAEAAQRRIQEYLSYNNSGVYTKLPNLKVMRAGAQSTTGVQSVANNWQGVGNLPEHATRVVLRVEAPSTSVLSLPVYGKNVIGEHESVLVGNHDRWLWDAWREKAPNFDNSPIVHTTRKADTQPLIIDLQAEDRGKPHWLSGLQSIAKFDEAEHPREPGGTPEGGRFTETGHVGEASSDPALAEQAKTGIVAVEKLLPEAIKTARFPDMRVDSWDEFDQDFKNQVYIEWVKDVAKAGGGAEEAKTSFDILPADTKFDLAYRYASSERVDSQLFEHKPHKEPDHWTTGIETGKPGEEDYVRTHVIAERLTELRTDELRKERGLLDPIDKPTYTIVEGFNSIPSHPVWVAKDKTGTVIASSNTPEQVKINAEEWATDKSLGARDVKTADLIRSVWTHWKSSSSSGLSLSLQLAVAQEFGGFHRLNKEELAEARYHAEAYGGIPTLQAYVRAQWEVTQAVMAKAEESKLDVYRALMLPGEQVEATPIRRVGADGKPIAPPTNIKILEQRVEPGQDSPDKPPEKVFVTFDYNGEHFVVEKKRHLPTYTPKTIQQIPKGGYPQETDAQAIQRRVDEYHSSGAGQRTIFTKLPELRVLRAGAQSTTGIAAVANDWGGVGNLPPDPTRVVLRIEAPSTSVLSLPVYGQNDAGEHESVLIGTKDKWLWDAWKYTAPNFRSQPVSSTTRKSDTKPLVIDLQAEDRGKPHWMSNVNWTAVLRGEPRTPFVSILKWDRNQPRNPKGSAFGGRWVSQGVSQALEGVQEEPLPTGRPYYQRARTIQPGMERTMGDAGYTDILEAKDKAPRRINQPRVTGMSPEQEAQLEDVKTAPARAVMEAIKTADIEDVEDTSGGHANSSYVVTLDDPNNTKALVKPEVGEAWEGGFANQDISEYITNKKFSLADREATAYEIGTALDIPFVPVTILRDNLDLASHNMGGEADGGHDSEQQRYDYSKYRERAQENAYEAAGEEMQNAYDEAVDEHVKAINSIVDNEMADIWQEELDALPKEDLPMSASMAREHPVLPMGSQPAFQRKDAEDPLNPINLLDEAKIDLDNGAGLNDRETERLREVIRQHLAEGYREIDEVDKDEARDHLDRDNWYEQHQSTEARLIESKIQSFSAWKHSQGFSSSGGGGEVKNPDAPHPNAASFQHYIEDHGSGTLKGENGTKLAVLDYVIGTMDRHGHNIFYDADDKPVMIDNGYSMPGSDTPDGFQFRSEPVRQWMDLAESRHIPQSTREVITKRLESTDWQALLARHPGMSTAEKEAFLGRVENMKQALKTENGLYELWQHQTLMGNW